MVKSNNLVAEVSAACRERLTSEGFRPRTGDIFTRSVAGDVISWLGLNRAVGPSGAPVEINPVFGVRHQALESLVAELLGAKTHCYIPATLSISLGYLMPNSKYRSWMFSGDSPVAGVADDLVAAVREYGPPYVKRHDSLAAIVQSMESGEGVKEFAALRLPVGYFLLGQRSLAMGALESSESAIGDRRDLAAQHFRAFAGNFRRTVDVSEGR